MQYSEDLQDQIFNYYKYVWQLDLTPGEKAFTNIYLLFTWLQQKLIF